MGQVGHLVPLGQRAMNAGLGDSGCRQHQSARQDSPHNDPLQMDTPS